MHSLGGDRTDPPEGFDRQTFDEFFRLGRMDGAQSVRLAVVRGDFSLKLIIRYPSRGNQMQLLPDFLLDCFGYVDGKRDVLFILGNIQKRLVQ